jgi:hypothetical protein
MRSNHSSSPCNIACIHSIQQLLLAHHLLLLHTNTSGHTSNVTRHASHVERHTSQLHLQANNVDFGVSVFPSDQLFAVVEQIKQLACNESRVNGSSNDDAAARNNRNMR